MDNWELEGCLLPSFGVSGEQRPDNSPRSRALLKLLRYEVSTFPRWEDR